MPIVSKGVRDIAFERNKTGTENGAFHLFCFGIFLHLVPVPRQEVVRKTKTLLLPHQTPQGAWVAQYPTIL